MEDQRAKFEAWGTQFGFPDVERHSVAPSTNYKNRDLTMAWAGWQASAAESAKEIERLREALEGMVSNFEPHAWGSNDNKVDALKVARAALSPASPEPLREAE